VSNTISAKSRAQPSTEGHRPGEVQRKRKGGADYYADGGGGGLRDGLEGLVVVFVQDEKVV
jgi:hypothetical protein